MERLIHEEMEDDCIQSLSLFAGLMCLLAVVASIADGHVWTMWPTLAWCALVGCMIGGLLGWIFFPISQAFGCSRDNRSESESDDERDEGWRLIGTGALIGAGLLVLPVWFLGALAHCVKGFQI